MNFTVNGSRSKTHSPVPSELDNVPPSDVEAERSVLGACLLDNDQIEAVRATVGESTAFHSPRNRTVWRALLAMRDAGQPIDAVTLRAELEDRGQLDAAGGVPHIVDLMQAVPHAEDAAYYARLVRDKAALRMAAEIGAKIVRLANAPGADAADVLATASDELQTATIVSPRRTFAGLDVAELETYATQEPDWLVQDVFTADEPLIVGARSKGCKTLQLVDLAVALASGSSWLGEFAVQTRRKVLFISGETNDRRMGQHIDNACRVRNLSFGDLSGMLRVESNSFPSLPSPDDLRSIARTVRQHGIEVVILDPLYRGMSGVDASQLNETGAAIKNFQAACSPACVILSHHVVKSAAREYGTPPSLEDMTGAGIAESCGQWWLVGRNEKYAWDGMHDLCVTYGGREGQAGGKRIVFDEKQWVFVVENLHDYIATADEERERQRDAAKSDAESRKLNQARGKILAACRNVKVPQARTRIRDASGQSGISFGTAFAELVNEQTLIVRPYRDSRNHTVPEGYILSEFAVAYDQTWRGN